MIEYSERELRLLAEKTVDPYYREIMLWAAGEIERLKADVENHGYEMKEALDRAAYD